MHCYSFDFGARYVEVIDWRLAFRVFSERNVYTPHPDAMSIQRRENGIDIVASEYAWAGGQRRCQGEFAAAIVFTESGFDCTIWAALPERIKGTVVDVDDLPIAAMPTPEYRFEPVPEEGGLLRYPNVMRVPVFPLQLEDGRYFAITTLDEAVQGKVVAVVPGKRSVAVELHHHADAKLWSCRHESPTWRIRHTTDPSPLFAERQAIMERCWEVKPWHSRPDVPSWAHDIALVVNLHGTHWTGYCFNNYAQQLKALQAIAEQLDGRHILAYLPGWDGRYNFNWPQYQADPEMGGEAGLKALVDGAHDLGIRVIPQFGAVSANREFLPPALHDCSSQDAFANTFYKPHLDWDMDRTGDGYRVNANIGHPAFRQFLFDAVHRVTTQFGFDGVFLDINMYHHNDPRFCIVEGHHEFARLCHEAFSDFLLFGEHWYDGILSAYGMVHSVNAPGCGAPRQWGEIFHDYCRTTHHLNYPAPGEGSTGVHEAGFIEPWLPDVTSPAIPALAIVDDTIAEHGDAVREHVNIAKAWLERRKS